MVDPISPNLPPDAYLEFKIVTVKDTIKARWELDWDGPNLGPQCLDFLYTGDVPTKVFIRAMLPVAGSTDGAMLGKITVGMDELTVDKLWHAEYKVVLYDANGRRSNIGLHTKFEWDPAPVARENLMFRASVYSVTGCVLPGTQELNPYVLVNTNSKGAYDPALNGQQRQTITQTGLGRTFGGASWEDGRGQVFSFPMKYFPTEVKLTCMHFDQEASDDVIGQFVLRDQIVYDDRTRPIEFAGTETLIALNQLGKPQKGKKAEVGSIHFQVQMWDPATHPTPVPMKWRVLKCTVLGCTNLATRDYTRANNPFVFIYVDGVPRRTYTAERGGINPKWKSGANAEFKNQGRAETPGIDLLFVVTGFPRLVEVEVMEEDDRENGAGIGVLASGTVELQKPMIVSPPTILHPNGGVG